MKKTKVFDKECSENSIVLKLFDKMLRRILELTEKKTEKDFVELSFY